MASVALLRIAAQSYRNSKLFANAAYKTCDATFNGVTGEGLPPSDTRHFHNIDVGRLEVATATALPSFFVTPKILEMTQLLHNAHA